MACGRAHEQGRLLLSEGLALAPQNRVQLTTDGHKPYLTVIEPLFGDGGVDFAILHKNYGTIQGENNPERTYSPATCTGIDKRAIAGNPDNPALDFDFLRGASKPHNANGYASLYEAHERLFKEGREPRSRGAAFTSCTTTSQDHTRH